MAFRIEQTAQAIADKQQIFEFLVESYQSFGEGLDSAIERASDQVLMIEVSIASLSRTPFQGTLHNEYSPVLRSVTKNRVILWFNVNESEQLIRVVAIFFGTQDHQRLMLRRMLARD